MSDPSLDPCVALQWSVDVHDIGQALLEGDLLEARFRAGAITISAESLACTSVARAAHALVVALCPPHKPPGRGVGQAYAALCTAVESLGDV
ncbi:hypothetical protein [Luteibacter sp. 9133]|uniref:hypothetical protein n=1 Tax=Luteibacter sp. 9133 TaxID=1500891 RepID=UPI0005BBE7CE|nr:hypothetical protein [Luteibacter sp. 9133]